MSPFFDNGQTLCLAPILEEVQLKQEEQSNVKSAHKEYIG